MKESKSETKPEKKSDKIKKIEKPKEEKPKEESKKKGSKLIPKLIPLKNSLPNEDGNLVIEEKENQQGIGTIEQEKQETIPNVVVRLRCQLSDLNNNNSNTETNPYEYKAWIPSEIKTYNTTEYQSGSLSMEPIHFIGMENIIGAEESSHKEEENTDTNYAYLDSKWLHNINKIKLNDSTPIMKQIIKEEPYLQLAVEPIKENSKKIEDSEFYKASISKDIQTKLQQQKVLLYHGLVKHQKKSACFWCTCDYDTPACAIPFYNVDSSMDSYGSFCRPECAVAYLYSEKLDDSVRADRDHLINFYYGKTYGYEKRIKPAPDPHYLLDKFYGNLTIQEYRKLLKSEHLLATLDKPLTRIFPELHEITDDFLIQIYGGDITLNRGYRVKRASEQVKGPSKMEILRDQFIPSKKPHHIRGVEIQG